MPTGFYDREKAKPNGGWFKKGHIPQSYIDGRKNRKYYCKDCGKLLSCYTAVYCSRCAKLGERSYFWKNGKSFEPYTSDFNQQLKDRIRVRDNFICQKCGVPELECDRRLDVHHIDYDKKNCNEDNLISLCCGCNSEVNANREYWTNCFQEKMKNDGKLVNITTERNV